MGRGRVFCFTPPQAAGPLASEANLLLEKGLGAEAASKDNNEEEIVSSVLSF